MNRSQLSAFIVGLIFGIGLLLAGMANPAKVLAFLDLAGDWDPSLALVMVGAIAVASVGFVLTKGRHLAWSGDPIQIPGNRKLDRRLGPWSSLLPWWRGWRPLNGWNGVRARKGSDKLQASSYKARQWPSGS